MAKIVPAACEDNVVTIEGSEVEAEILSEGVGASTGIAIIDVDRVYYVASSAPDIKASLEALVEGINKIADVLTAIGAGMTGPTTAPPPTLAVDVASIQAIASELETLSEGLI